MTDGDNYFASFQYMNSEAEYLVALDGFLHLIKITRDDANFQTFCKDKMNYLFDRVSRPLRSILFPAPHLERETSCFDLTIL